MPVEERHPPQWLNAALLTKALREGLKQPSLQVNSCQINPATAVGDNYASLMFRAVLEIITKPGDQPQRMSVVCKTLPKGDEVKEMMASEKNKFTVFEKEAKLLMEVLPEINKYLMSAFPNQQPLCAECLWFSKEPEEILILSDLKESGFGLLDRMGGLDLEVSKLTLSTLGKLHAGSLALLERNPNKIKGLTDNIWIDESQDGLPKMLNTFLSALIDTISGWDDFPDEYFQKIKNLEGNIVGKMRDSLKTDEHTLKVLQHGDCWINNMMFRTENGRIDGFRFVDFQMCCLNSAAMDLNYFIFTSPSGNIRIEKIDEMLHTYFTSFMEAVKILGVTLSKKFTLNDLKKEFRARAFFGFVALIFVYPITITESEDAIDIKDFFNDGVKKNSFFKSKTFKGVFESCLPYFIECGVI